MLIMPGWILTLSRRKGQLWSAWRRSDLISMLLEASGRTVVTLGGLLVRDLEYGGGGGGKKKGGVRSKFQRSVRTTPGRIASL